MPNAFQNENCESLYLFVGFTFMMDKIFSNPAFNAFELSKYFGRSMLISFLQFKKIFHFTVKELSHFESQNR